MQSGTPSVWPRDGHQNSTGLGHRTPRLGVSLTADEQEPSLLSCRFVGCLCLFARVMKLTWDQTGKKEPVTHTVKPSISCMFCAGSVNIHYSAYTWCETTYSRAFESEQKAHIYKKTCAIMFTMALFRIAPIWKQPEWPSETGRMKRLWYSHTDEYSELKRVLTTDL